MKNIRILGILFICAIVSNGVLPVFSADTLLAADFLGESWAKTIDFFDYARAYATLHGMQVPPAACHAYTYMTYVNTSGLKMLYAGLSNITFDGAAYFTIPMQTLMVHYKTENSGRDVLMASNFLMLMAFNDTEQSLYPNSPDMYDSLWSSFSMGFNFRDVFPNASFPSLNSETKTFPLTHSDDKLQWSWGMKYTNLTAVWWRTFIAPTNQTYHTWPTAIATYDELDFNYTLTISPTTHKATLTENHVIGRLRDIWVFWGWFILPLYDHYNSTGCYRYGTKISSETIYEFIQRNQIKMSIVDFQTSVMLDHSTYSQSTAGQNVTDNDNFVSDSSVSTYTDDGEKIIDTSFGTKETYRLYNYTSDPSEEDFETYNATARTCKITGFAQDTDLFVFHNGLMRFLPLIVANMHPQLYQRAKESITNMSRANYFYLIAYPTYSGYRIVHDPTITMYLTTSESASTPGYPHLGLILTIGVIATAVILGVAVLRLVEGQDNHRSHLRPRHDTTSCALILPDYLDYLHKSE